MSAQRGKGSRAYAFGLRAERVVCEALVRDGWSVLGRRLRTDVGEIDIVAEKQGLLAFVEVKARPTLLDAVDAISARQQKRLLLAAEILLAEHPTWGIDGVRFDVIVVDAKGSVRRVADAFRVE